MPTGMPWATTLRELIAPARCMMCLREDTWLCTSCRKHLPEPLALCIGCDEPSFRGRTCRDCRENTPVAGMLSAGPISHAIFRRATTWLSKKRIRHLADDVASLLIPHLQLIAPLTQLPNIAALIPLPITNHEKRQRGFNQNDDIAQAIAKYTTIPIIYPLHSSDISPLRYSLFILVSDVGRNEALTDAAKKLRAKIPANSEIWVITVTR